MKRKLKINDYIFVVLSFLILTFISIYLVLRCNKLFFIQKDSFFHLGRVEELLKSNKLFPTYAFNSFSDIGSSVMIMYPYIFLYPMLLIFKLTRSIKYTILIYYVLGSVVSFLISFFSSISFSKSKLVSYIFSLIYTFSGEFLAMYFYSHKTDIGVYLSAIFLPLVIFGFLYFLKYNNWLMLSIGMSLTFFSNIISVTFLSFLLLCFFLMNYKNINKHKILCLLKAVSLTSITTVWIWLPIIKLVIFNKINIPSSTYANFNLVSLRWVILAALHNNFSIGCQSLSLFALIGGILGLVYFSKLSKMLKKLYIFSLIILLFCSKFFPWKILLSYNIVRHLQTTVRLFVVPQLILEYILAVVFAKLLQNKKYIMRVMSFIFFFLIIIFFQLDGQKSYINQGMNLFRYNRDVSHKIIKSSLNVHVTDYWPKASLPKKQYLFHNNGYYNKDNIHIIPTGNGHYHFYCSHSIKELNMPILQYKNVNYKLHLNGKVVKFKVNKYSLLTIFNLRKGVNNICVNVYPDNTLLISRALSILSLPIYVLVIFYKKKNI